MQRILLLVMLFITISVQGQTTWVVDSLNDSGFGSLRAAADSCSAGDTIRFNPNLIANGSDSIVLTGGVILFNNKGVVIKGLCDSIDTLYISGNQNNQIFGFSYSSRVEIDSVYLINSSSNSGGAIYAYNCTDTCLLYTSPSPRDS